MNEYLSYKTFRNYTYSNDKFCKKPFKGLVVQFHGCGDTDVFNEDINGTVITNNNKTHAQKVGEIYAEQGILYIVPYTTPWNWMDDKTATFVDDLVSVLLEEYGLKDFPIASTGPSMGGLGGLMYTIKSKHQDKIIVCSVNCPVADLVSQFENSDVTRRTILTKFYDSGDKFIETVKAHSPIHNVDKFPKIGYHLFHCDKDTAVPIENTERLYNAMKEQGLEVTYHVEPNRGHCQLTKELGGVYRGYVIEAFNNFKGFNK